MSAPVIASRASWGARYADGDGVGTNPATEVFVHHSVTTQLSPSASVAQEQEQMRELEQIGEDRFGRGISYHVVIFPSGRAYQGVSWTNRGTQCENRNSASRGICFAGNYDVNQPTTAALDMAASIYAYGKGRWWTSSAPLRGHRDVKQTACPGQYLYAQLDYIRNPPKPKPPTPQIGSDDVFSVSCNVKGDPQEGTWWIVVPQGGGKPRATVLGQQDQRTGVPHIAFAWANSWSKFKAGITWA